MTDHYELLGSIRRNLHDIGRHYDAALEPVRRAQGSPIKSSKQAPLPVPAHILDIRLDAYNDLQFWARFLLDEVRDVNGATITVGPVSTHPRDTAAFITIWADWLITNRPDDADNLHTESGKHAYALRGIVEELGSRKFTIGTCPAHGTSDTGERVPCDGNLRAVLRKDGDTLPSEVGCTVDPEHRWPAREWMQLGRSIRDAMTG